jgi:glycine/D-amino acid oxidase-like deaminating enzyme
VGSGVVGAATAYYLSREGADVTLLDSHEPAWGASGRNPGYLWLHTRSEGSQIELGLAGRMLYNELVTEIGDFEFRASGGMVYFFEEQKELFPQFVANRRECGLPMELLGSEDARSACPILPPDVAGATFNPLDAHVNPAALVNRLVEAAAQHGAVVRHSCKVEELTKVDDRCTGVKVADGAISADIVVLATAAWTSQLLGPFGLDLPIVPMRLQMASTAPIETRFDPVLYGPTGVKQYALTKDLPGYDADVFTHPLEEVMPGLELLELAAQTKDGRVLIGCPMDFVGFDDSPTVGGCALTCGVLADHLPALKDVTLERVWAGLLPQTPDALPVLGAVESVQGLAIAAGHVFGMLAGPISGKLVAQSLLGQQTDLPISPFRFERPSIAQALEGHRRW